MGSLFGLLFGWGTPVAASSAGQALKAADSVRTVTLLLRRHNAFKFSPFSLAGGHLSVFYERALPARFSVVLGYGGVLNNLAFKRDPVMGSGTYRRATLEVRHYFEQQALRGLYAGSYLRVSQLRETHFVPDPPGQHSSGYLQTQQALIWIPGVMVGHQLLTKWVVVDTFLGLQAQIVRGDISRTNQLVEAMTSRTALRIGLMAGLPF